MQPIAAQVSMMQPIILENATESTEYDTEQALDVCACPLGVFL